MLALVLASALGFSTENSTYHVNHTVNLRSANDFAVLGKTGISNVPGTQIFGNIGVSPISAGAITGFGLRMHPTNTKSLTSALMEGGRVYASDYTTPTPTKMLGAIADFETAYGDAFSRSPENYKNPTLNPANIDFKSGTINGEILTAGVYTWNSHIVYKNEIFIKGSPTDHFIFQTTGNIYVGSESKMTLLEETPGGGFPTPSNIVWQVAGLVDVGTYSKVYGTFLVKIGAVFKTGSTLIGRAFSMTAVTFDFATVRIMDLPPPHE
jgi:hypothetical protein